MSVLRLEPGEVVVGRVDDRVGEKRRPVILVYERAGQWMVVPVTTRGHSPGGAPREPVPFPERSGLARESFLWASGPVMVATGDLLTHMGWATDSLVDVVAGLIGVSAFELEPMRPHARADRRRAARRRVA